MKHISPQRTPPTSVLHLPYSDDFPNIASNCGIAVMYSFSCFFVIRQRGRSQLLARHKLTGAFKDEGHRTIEMGDTDTDALINPVAPAANESGGGEDFASYRTALREFVARQLRDCQQTDDVVQDIYYQLLQYPAREAILNPRAWLWRIAWRVLNRARSVKRESKVHITVDPQTIEEWAEHNGVHVTASVETQVEAADELLSALNQLPLPVQIAIVRSRRDGWSLSQIAQELGCSTHTVEKHLTKAITHFSAVSRTKAAQIREVGP